MSESASLEIPVTVKGPGRDREAVIQELSPLRCGFRSLSSLNTGDVVELAVDDARGSLVLKGTITSVQSRPPRIYHEASLAEMTDTARHRLLHAVEAAERAGRKLETPDQPLQRAYSRVKADFPVHFHFGKSDEGDARAVNVSIGGMMMTSPTRADVGETFVLKFRLTDSPELALRSRVVARQPQADGAFVYHLAFFNVEPAARGHLVRFTA
ncbi:MAG: PilZ domain-containing protein [Candidatus Eremiobacteraeota bacterium]|nr:PilZ domain-containing protein [Candidatus Eremiobacteraeota bacterium]